MNPSKLHHPDVSLAVLGRRAADFFLDMLCVYGEVAVTRGRSALWGNCFPSRTAYHAAVRRLQKKGAVKISRARDGRRILQVAGTREESAALHPDRYWKKRWDGWWRVLVYDVPESERAFRNGLRRFLTRLRMGYLQHSVWISPWDIRPDYADLEASLGVESLSFLFEAHTVLGRASSDLVLEAWDFEQLSEVHRNYLSASDAYLTRLRSAHLTREQVADIAREEMMHYLHAMDHDPLLPRALLPAGYHGFQVFEQHSLVAEQIRRLIRT